jgi:tetratricopeptide (TPR) repeat protein
MHYMIHANDVPGREHDALDVTHKYGEVAPRNPHALHMPTHIYTRLGEWGRVISGNLQAAEAALEHPAGEHGEFVWDEFPHAIEYLVYAYLQKGMNDEAGAQVHRLLSTPDLEPTFKTAFHLASTQARYALERHAWSEAAALVPRAPATLDWNRFAWPEAITHFARGLGAAHLSRSEVSSESVERLAALETSMRTAGEEIFANNIQMLQLELSAWIAHASGRQQEGVDLLRQAAALESSTPKHAVTPGPTLPAEELLGDMLMEQGRPADALAAYQRALNLYPRRFNSQSGVTRAARVSGDTQEKE